MAGLAESFRGGAREQKLKDRPVNTNLDGIQNPVNPTSYSSIAVNGAILFVKQGEAPIPRNKLRGMFFKTIENLAAKNKILSLIKF